MRRRDVLAAGAAAGALCVLPGGAGALARDEARAHVRSAVDDVLALVKSTSGPEEMAPKLRDLLERYAALDRIAKFAAGRSWRDMSGSQQERFVDAFAGFVSRIYAERFQQYDGQTVEIGEVADAGRKGLLVRTTVTQPEGAPVAVDWLVSDRPGRTVIADLVIEGVSLLVTQREEIGAMLDKRGGDVDELIEDLARG